MCTTCAQSLYTGHHENVSQGTGPPDGPVRMRAPPGRLCATLCSPGGVLTTVAGQPHQVALRSASSHCWTRETYTCKHRILSKPALTGILQFMPSHLRKRSKKRDETARQAAIYSRVSRLDPRLTDEESESIASQDDECREACEVYAWPVFREYADPGISASEFAKDKERPDWTQLLADVESGAVRVVLLWESSRGDRKPIEWLQFLYACRDADCLIHIVSHDLDRKGTTYDMRRNSDLHKLSQEGLDNAKASWETSSRLKRVKRRRRAKGLPDGAIPFGYRRVYNPATGKIVAQEPDPDEAATVRGVFAELAAHEHAKATARKYGLSVSGLRHIASRKAYISVIEHDGEEFPAQWRPVLFVPGEHREVCDDSVCAGCAPDTATFYKVQSIFAERRLNGSRPGGVKYLLSCIARCGVDGCVGSIVGTAERVRMVKHGTGMRQVRSTAKYGCTEGHVGVGMADLNTYVSAVIVEYYSQPGRYEELIKADDAGVVAAQADLARIDSELKALYADAQAGKLSRTMAASLEQGLLRQQEEADERRVSQVPPAVRDLLKGPVKELAARWVAMPLAARRDIVKATVNVIVHPAGGKGRRVPVAERVDVTGKQ